MYATKILYSNPFVTEAIARRMSEKLFGLTFQPCNVRWRGNAAHEAGDAVRLIDRAGNVHIVLIMSQVMDFGGGLSSQISCPGDTGEEADGMMTTPTGQQISVAMGQVDADLKKYIAEVCQLTLQQANAYTDEAVGGIVDGNEVQW